MSGRSHPKSLAIIPARGGSKRLKRKNVRIVGGHPLIAHTIRAAQGAQDLTDYVVSSEDDEILNISRTYDAPVPFKRPAELATDTVRNIDVMIHALEFMEHRSGSPYDIVILLQPTAPIRTASHIDVAIEKLWASDADTLASVKGPYRKRDPNLKRVNEDGILEAYCDRATGEDWEPFYIYNASIYAMRRDYLLTKRKMVSDRQVPLFMDELHSIDVDTELDAIIADTVLKHKLEQTKDEENK
jgi:CMP-N,N'-diacetyllegionaminic acid synthase